MKTHLVTLSNGKMLSIREGINSISLYHAECPDGDDWWLLDINSSGITCSTSCGSANDDIIRGLKPVTCGDLIFKDDWAFAESSNRPWAQVDPSSVEGAAIMGLYERYKPTMQMLNEEGSELPFTQDFFEYVENAFDAQCLNVSVKPRTFKGANLD